MNLQRAISKLFSARVLNAGLNFAAISGFTQLLGTGTMGSFFLFQTIIGLVGIPGNLGVNKATEKALSADESVGSVVSSSILLKLLLLAPWLVLLGALHKQVEAYVGADGIIFLIVSGIVVNQFRKLSLRLLAGRMQVEQTAVLRVFGRLTWVGVGFAGIQLISGLSGLYSVILAFIAADFVVMLTAVIRLDVNPGRPNFERMRSLVTFGRYVFVGSVGGYVYSWMDVAILRFFVSPSVIGAYEIAWRVAALSMMLTNAIRESLFPKISKLYTENNIERIGNLLNKWIQPPLFVAIPAFAGLIVLGEDVLATFFTSEATIAYTVLLIFSLEKVFRSINIILGPALFAIDQPELGYRGSIVAIAVNLVLNLLLIPIFGIHGAAVATGLGALTSMGVNIWYLSQFVPIRFPWARIVWVIRNSAVMGILIFFLHQYYFDGIIGLLLKIGSGVCIFFLLVLANGDIRKDIKSMVV